MKPLAAASATPEFFVFLYDVVVVDGWHTRQQPLLEAVVFRDVRTVNDFLRCARDEG